MIVRDYVCLRFVMFSPSGLGLVGIPVFKLPIGTLDCAVTGPTLGCCHQGSYRAGFQLEELHLNPQTRRIVAHMLEIGLQFLWREAIPWPLPHDGELGLGGDPRVEEDLPSPSPRDEFEASTRG